MPQADGSIAAEVVMDAKPVANSVMYMATFPPDASVQFAMVIATNPPFIGRG